MVFNKTTLKGTDKVCISVRLNRVRTNEVLVDRKQYLYKFQYTFQTILFVNVKIIEGESRDYPPSVKTQIHITYGSKEKSIYIRNHLE